MNDFSLLMLFKKLVELSAPLPPEERVVMYDACDEQEVSEPLGFFRRRLDARRNKKPRQAAVQRHVCTPFDPAAFNFSKIRDARERLLTLGLKGGEYELLANRFPLFRAHILLVARSLVPQQMSTDHLHAVSELVEACSFCAYFNSWCASASVNHFHVHVVGEMPPVTHFPLVGGPTVCGVRCLHPDGFPGFCYVFPTSHLKLVDRVVKAMQVHSHPLAPPPPRPAPPRPVATLTALITGGQPAA